MSATTSTSEGPQTLLASLIEFQKRVPRLVKDSRNPHFGNSYASLDGIVAKVRPRLTRLNLVWTTFPCVDPHGNPALRYVLAHAISGESMEGTMPLVLAKKDPQGQGSAITYARRYAMCAVLGLIADEDDDGNSGSNSAAAAAQTRQASPAAQPETTVDKDAERPASPPIPRDRAKAIADAAVAAKLAAWVEGGGLSMEPVLKAQLGLIGVSQIGQLNVDQAETLDAFIKAEAGAE